jgi:transcriptional regulator of acetoin/glycerol metabolism
VIAQARRAALHEGGRPVGLVAPWIERSWQRCLANRQDPQQRLAFDAVSAPAMRRALDMSHPLLEAARPVLEKLSRAIATTRYFTILTDARGVVVETQGPIDRSDRRAAVIARVGVDLSEAAVGTTAIGAALAELQSVWLHRGEHFFDDTGVYSCAGSPLFGPDGSCIGMLDLTGVDVPERPELKHLVTQSARSIENALVLAQPHAVLLRLNWPGRDLGGESDGLLVLDDNGCVVGGNAVARQLLPQPVSSRRQGPLHASDLFAMPWEMLFDVARRDGPAMDVPLWSGLRLSAMARRAGARGGHPEARGATPLPARSHGGLALRDVETALIHRAVEDARGNVAEAARVLGISRATVYRKLHRKAR